LIEYQKSLQRVQLSAGSKLEAMRVEEAVGNNKGGLAQTIKNEPHHRRSSSQE